MISNQNIIEEHEVIHEQDEIPIEEKIKDMMIDIIHEINHHEEGNQKMIIFHQISLNDIQQSEHNQWKK